MRKCSFFLVLFLVAGWFAGHRSQADATASVEEDAIVMRSRGTSSLIELPVVNPFGKPVTVRARVEILAPDETVVAQVEVQTIVPAGRRILSMTMDFHIPEEIGGQHWNLQKLRLRYSVLFGEDSRPRAGIIALGRVMRDFFNLEIVAPRGVVPGQRLQIPVRTVNPFSKLPVAGVAVTATIAPQQSPAAKPIPASLMTDSEGNGLLTFRIPSDVSETSFTLSVNGELGPVRQSSSLSLWVTLSNPLRLLSTDKPFYQPGQTMHARLLAFTSSRRALAKAKFRISVQDEKDETLFDEIVETSRLGVARLDWAIPENVRLGSCTVRAQQIDPEENESRLSVVGIDIQRYELPTFTVAAESDRTFYLPQETAVLTVRGDYLFGRPVRDGKVRIVRLGELKWNETLRKLENEQVEILSGEVDEKGLFSGRVEVSRLSDEFPDTELFRDLPLTAIVTDPSTGRTESRRFDLRLTREAIHISVSESPTIVRGLPPNLLVSTFRADGTPLSCDVALYCVPVGSDFSSVKPGAPRLVPVGTMRTSRYGVGVIPQFPIPELNSGDEFALRMVAKAEALSGMAQADVKVLDLPAVRVATDALLYRPGQPVTVDVTGSSALNENDPVMVRVVSRSGVEATKFIRLEGRKGKVVFHETGKWTGPVTFLAAQPFFGSSTDVAWEPRTVLFPDPAERLNVETSLNRADFRPGDPARLSLGITDGAGRPVAGAFGVVVADRAIGERYRRDSGKDFIPFVSGNEDAFQRLTESAEFAGVTLDDIRALDPAQPLPDGIEPVVEQVLAQAGNNAEVETIRADTVGALALEGVFRDSFHKSFEPVRMALDQAYNRGKDSMYPTDLGSFQKIMAAGGVRNWDIPDPWGQSYRISFDYENYFAVTFADSAGPDKRWGTEDDLHFKVASRPYFAPVSDTLDRAAASFLKRTGDIVPDPETLIAELKNQGIEFAALRDPKGRPYRIEAIPSAPNLVLMVKGDSLDGKETLFYWTVSHRLFSREATIIRKILRTSAQAAGTFPTTVEELRSALKAGGVEFDHLSDGLGRPVRPVFTRETRKAERGEIREAEGHTRPGRKPTFIQKLEQQVVKFELLSDGPDHKPGTEDDFTLMTIRRVVAEKPVGQPFEQPSPGWVFPPPVEPGKGNVTGIVRDTSGAVITGVTVTARSPLTGKEFSATTDGNGRYLLSSLPEGLYDLAFSSNHFKTESLPDFEVRSQITVEINADLEVEGSFDVVEVSGGQVVQLTMTTQSSLTRQTLASNEVCDLPVNGRNFSQTELLRRREPEVTPRVREYFPETLLWQPEIVTDAKGRATVPFKLADSLTTWRVNVIGSTEDGRVAVAQRDIVAFQPFFVELDPPRILTTGDEIALPILVRNYLNQEKPVSIELSPANWFSTEQGATRTLSVGPDEAGKTSIPIRVTAPVKDGKQRVSIRSGREADAVEKPVTVHPDGFEKTETVAGTFFETRAFEATIPEPAIPNSAHLELKIFPNLATHLFEGITGILRRPHGCGEQTISSTYPNVLVLQYLNRIEAGNSPSRTLALKYAREGYERLLTYQDSEGGFTYWGRGKPDPALTAYAIGFLKDAAECIPVDESVRERAVRWLLKGQTADGSWREPESEGSSRTSGRVLMDTAALARILAGEKAPESVEAARKAVAFLDARLGEMDEAYTAAAFAIAARANGQTAIAERAEARLRELADPAGAGIGWKLREVTPFNGWGATGDIEANALAVLALSGTGRPEPLAERAFERLLERKDKYGVWHSTQATVLVEKVLLSLALAEPTGPRSVQVRIDGRPFRTVPLPVSKVLTAPLAIDLTELATPGRHRIELIQIGGKQRISAQVVGSYFLPWADAPSPPANAPRMEVAFDRTDCGVGEVVRCDVKVRRGDGPGHGMLVAEIGLPPGAQVDPASLGLETAGTRLERHEIQPDRVVLYFSAYVREFHRTFTFRPRFGMKAKTASSTVYDYYNPEAATTLAPVLFVVGPRASGAQ